MLSGTLSRRRARLKQSLSVRPAAARHRRVLSAWRRGVVERRPRSNYLRVLGVLGRAERALPSSTIASSAGGMTSSHAASHLAHGVGRGHVKRDARERKRNRYSITAAGRQYLLELGAR
jgi:hypothetical protein